MMLSEENKDQYEDQVMHDAGLDVNEDNDFAVDQTSPKAAVEARGGRGSRGGAIRAKAAPKPKVAPKSKVLV